MSRDGKVHAAVEQAKPLLRTSTLPSLLPLFLPTTKDDAMSRYAIEYTDGRVTEIVADNDTQAELVALERIGGDAIACDQWDADGISEDGEQGRRLLIWATEEDSINDDGANAIAAVTYR